MNTNNFVPFKNDHPSNIPPPNIIDTGQQPSYDYPVGVGQPNPAQYYQPNPPMQNPYPAANYGVPITNPFPVKDYPDTRHSEPILCRNCQTMMPTNVKFITGTGTWVSCGVIALFGCWLGCCLFPFCIEDCQDAVHYCAGCGNELGRKKFLFN